MASAAGSSANSARRGRAFAPIISGTAEVPAVGVVRRGAAPNISDAAEAPTVGVVHHASWARKGVSGETTSQLYALLL